MNKENKYYVYLHRDLNGVVFYVGKGTKNRCFHSCNRSKKWKTKAESGWTCQIVKDNLLNNDALILEKDLISIYSSTVINHVSSQIVKDIPFSKFSDVFYYDETSPSGLRWNISRYRFSKGDVAGSELLSNGVPRGWRVMFNRKSYYVHRIIWTLFYGETDKNMVIDHLDGNTQNNTISNLSIKTHRGNMLNKLCRKTSTGITGVTEKIDRNGKVYFRATWVDRDGCQSFKTFSINKYGKEEAFRLACEVRLKEIEELRLLGFDYTDRHIMAQ